MRTMVRNAGILCGVRRLYRNMCAFETGNIDPFRVHNFAVIRFLNLLVNHRHNGRSRVIHLVLSHGHAIDMESCRVIR